MSDQDGLFTDGGIRGRNPSPLGGSWCWILVASGLPVREESGFVTPADVGLPTVTNNVTELIAALHALEGMPPGWCGTLYTDSQITLYRVEQRAKGRKAARMAGVPSWIQERLQRAKARLGAYRVSLLGGHPTAHELNRGCRADGLPVSLWNVHCDRVCRRLAEEGLSKSTAEAPLPETVVAVCSLCRWVWHVPRCLWAAGQSCPNCTAVLERSVSRENCIASNGPGGVSVQGRQSEGG